MTEQEEEEQEKEELEEQEVEEEDEKEDLPQGNSAMELSGEVKKENGRLVSTNDDPQRRGFSFSSRFIIGTWFFFKYTI